MARGNDLALQASRLQSDLVRTKRDFAKRFRRAENFIKFLFFPVLAAAGAGIIYFIFTV